MSRERAGAGRFATGVAGALVVSVAWLALMTATSTTPGEARERRAAPRLPVPVVALRTVSGPGGPALVVPAGAIATARDGTSRVEVIDSAGRREVPITTGRSRRGLVEVTGAGLREGDEVRLFPAPQHLGAPGG